MTTRYILTSNTSDESYFIPEWVRDYDVKSNKLNLDHYFFNVIISKTIAHAGFTFSLICFRPIWRELCLRFVFIKALVFILCKQNQETL